MNQQEVEQWIAQQGGSGTVQYSRSTREVDNPAADPLTAKAAGVAYSPNATDKVTVSEEKWTAVDAEGKPTGAVLHVRRKPDGDFDIVDQANQNPSKNGEQTPEQKNAAELQRQREKNAALPADQDPAYETDADRRARGEARIKQQGADAKAADDKARQQRIDEQAQADKNKPTVTVQQVTRNGQSYTVHTSTPRDGSAPTITTFGPDGKPVGTLPAEVKPGEIVKGGGEHGEDVQAVPDPDHPGQIKLVPLPGAQVPSGRRPLPPGMPALDTSSPENAEQSYLAQQAWAQQQRDAGRLSSAEIVELLTPSWQAAKSVVDMAHQGLQDATSVRGQDLTERGQDLGEVQSRRSAADTGFDNLFSHINGNAAHLGRGNGGLAVAAFREAIGLRQANAEQAGGYQDVPGTQISPAMQSVRSGSSTTIHPDGTVQIAHAPAAAPAPSAPEQAAPWMPSTGDPNNPTNEINPNAVGMARPAYLDAARAAPAAPAFDPSQSQTVARLRAQGMPEEDIQQVIAEHHQEFAA